MFGIFKPRHYRRDRHRKIFRYWNGYRYVYGDPLAIQDRIEMHPAYVADRHPKLAMGDGKQAVEAWQICMDCYRKAFLLKPLDPTTGKGLTDNEVLELLGHFDLYMGYVKKNSSVKQTIPQPTEPTPQANETTSDTLATSSTSSGKHSEGSTTSGPALNTR